MATENSVENHINVNNLTFSYPGQTPVLQNLNMQLAPGARCLLIGANGAGKSTLLRILGGRHLPKPDESVRVLGMSAYHSTQLNFERSYLDTDWGMRTVAFAGYGCPLQADIPVHKMMEKLQEQYPERREELIDILGIDVNWRMHQVSDGQRRRVQIFLGLIRPFKILLLDEVTVSLDVIVRMDLLQWLKKESETRGATILYATHIFDGLDDWPTHLHYLQWGGYTGWQGKMEDLEIYQGFKARGEYSPLLRVAEHWLRSELSLHKQRKEARMQENGKDSDMQLEPADGMAARTLKDPTQSSFHSGGGFAPGRMSHFDFIGGK